MKSRNPWFHFHGSIPVSSLIGARAGRRMPVMNPPLPVRRRLLVALALATAGAAGEPPADALLAAAPERISRHRMGTLAVRVVDAEGRPLAGVRVTTGQLRHQFLFGCNIFAFDRFATPAENQLYQEQFAALFNFATLPFYWSSYERRPGETDAERIARIAGWCHNHRITPKGHPLVWNHPAGAPGWLPDDPAAVAKLSDARVRDCVTRFRGLIDLFDVVNEAADPLRDGMDNPMTALVRHRGVEAYTRTPFELARAANPEATLLINDYRTDAAYEKVIQQLRAGDTPLYQVIGIQSHMHDGLWPAARTWETCERFARCGAPLHFTETTLVSGPREGDRWGATTPELEQTQARQVVEFYTLLFSHPEVEAITWWDLADAHAWQGAPAGLLRRDLSRKPAFTALHELVRNQWWTRTNTPTGPDGTASVRAFFGTHRVSCSLPDGRSAAAEVALDRRQGHAACELMLHAPPGRPAPPGR